MGLSLIAADPERIALDTVRKWRFKPGTCDGKPMSMTMTIEIPSVPR